MPAVIDLPGRPTRIVQQGPRFLTKGVGPAASFATFTEGRALIGHHEVPGGDFVYVEARELFVSLSNDPSSGQSEVVVTRLDGSRVLRVPIRGEAVVGEDAFPAFLVANATRAFVILSVGNFEFELLALEIDTGQLLKRWSFPCCSMLLAMSPDGSRVWLASWDIGYTSFGGFDASTLKGVGGGEVRGEGCKLFAPPGRVVLGTLDVWAAPDTLFLTVMDESGPEWRTYTYRIRLPRAFPRFDLCRFVYVDAAEEPISDPTATPTVPPSERPAPSGASHGCVLSSGSLLPPWFVGVLLVALARRRRGLGVFVRVLVTTAVAVHPSGAPVALLFSVMHVALPGA